MIISGCMTVYNHFGCVTGPLTPGCGRFDTGVRVERSKVASVNYDMDVYNNLPRVMTSLFFDTNLIPQEPDILLTYIGDLEDYKGISLVASSQNNGNPCVDGSIAAMDPLIGGPAGNQTLAFVVCPPGFCLRSNHLTLAQPFIQSNLKPGASVLNEQHTQ